MATSILATLSDSFADVVVIIPALNEAASIGQVLSDLPRWPWVGLSTTAAAITPLSLPDKLAPVW